MTVPRLHKVKQTATEIIKSERRRARDAKRKRGQKETDNPRTPARKDEDTDRRNTLDKRKRCTKA